jgi:hypothetical protein
MTKCRQLEVAGSYLFQITYNLKKLMRPTKAPAGGKKPLTKTSVEFTQLSKHTMVRLRDRDGTRTIQVGHVNKQPGGRLKLSHESTYQTRNRKCFSHFVLPHQLWRYVKHTSRDLRMALYAATQEGGNTTEECRLVFITVRARYTSGLILVHCLSRHVDV